MIRYDTIFRQISFKVTKYANEPENSLSCTSLYFILLGTIGHYWDDDLWYHHAPGTLRFLSALPWPPSWLWTLLASSGTIPAGSEALPAGSKVLLV